MFNLAPSPLPHLKIESSPSPTSQHGQNVVHTPMHLLALTQNHSLPFTQHTFTHVAVAPPIMQ
ncbi:hypothetical protein PIB30_086569, partial [Stylosanthes scabra]|nr:hypothetical protein [Stylosanthes scabra]